MKSGTVPEGPSAKTGLRMTIQWGLRYDALSAETSKLPGSGASDGVSASGAAFAFLVFFFSSGGGGSWAGS